MDALEALSAVFGPESSGRTPEERAKTSRRMFVRSEDHLAFDSAEATGRRLTAWEALSAFGWEKLLEIVEYDVAVIAVNSEEPASSIKSKRSVLAKSISELANASGVSEAEARDAEDPNTRTDIHILTKIAQKLGLDDLRLGAVIGGGADPRFAYRIRSLNVTNVIRKSTMFDLNEAAWVVSKQLELTEWLGDGLGRKTLDQWGFRPDPNYGDFRTPAWKHGFRLADRTREILGLAPDAPIASLRALLEETLEIPLIQMELEKRIAGATIEAEEGQRGILVNILGDNKNELVRRATLAHELAHILWDSGQQFQYLTIDSYDDLQYSALTNRSPVEVRANAFAVNFVAPQQAAVEVFRGCFEPARGLRAVMDHFGISYTAAKWQIFNGIGSEISMDRLVVSSALPADHWSGQESFAIHHFRPQSTPFSRRGRFAACVAEAFRRKLISASSASLYLRCTEAEVEERVPVILEQFGLAAH